MGCVPGTQPPAVGSALFHVTPHKLNGCHEVSVALQVKNDVEREPPLSRVDRV